MIQLSVGGNLREKSWTRRYHLSTSLCRGGSGNHHGTLPHFHPCSQRIKFHHEARTFFLAGLAPLVRIAERLKRPGAAPPPANRTPTTPPHHHPPSPALSCAHYRSVERKCGMGEVSVAGGRRGSGWGEGRMRVARRGRGGRGRSWARSNGIEPHLSACSVYGGAGGAPAEVGGVNCAQGETAGGRAGGGQQSITRRGVGGRG